MNVAKLKPGNAGVLYSNWFAFKREEKAKKFMLKRKEGLSTTHLKVLYYSKFYDQTCLYLWSHT